MYTPKQFSLSHVTGISEKNIQEHYLLYEGYIKNTNMILETINQPASVPDYALREMYRRFGFEFNGMRNHEYFFEQWTFPPQPLGNETALYKKITSQFGSFDAWQQQFSHLAINRGVGWAVLYYDPVQDLLISTWIDEQHIGHLHSVQWILGIDMWEHAYIYDYPTSDKKSYITAWFDNLNWEIISKRFGI